MGATLGESSCKEMYESLVRRGGACNIPPSNPCNRVLVIVNLGFESNSIRIQFKFSSNSGPELKSNFIWIWLTFGQNAQYKSCGKYSNLSPCKISHFSKVPKYFFLFYFSSAWKSKWKRNSKNGKASRAIFLRTGLLLPCLDPSPRVNHPASLYRAAVADRRGPPVRAIFPQSPLLRARVSSSAHTTSMPTFHLPSWAIASPSRDVKRHVMLLIALLSPVVAPAEMHAPGAQRWSLAPPASLAELMRTKAHRLGPYVALLART
jgi:hypothetical protein